MPITCQHKQVHGPQFCISDCPVNAPCGVFLYQRIEKVEAIPAPDERILDVALLDMNHGWPNLGHNSLVHLVKDASCDVLEDLQSAGLVLRVLSYNVRQTGILPEKPGNRFHIYVGTGGPANINPHENDGVSEGSQGVQEDPSWEASAFQLFSAIRDNENAVLLGVCHTFGTMCRWSGVAEPTLRGENKGGKSTGVLENLLTPEGLQHPWFRRLSECLPDKRRLRIMDNRLFDLIPGGTFTDGLVPIGYETQGVGGSQGNALTMLEWARDRGGVMPRIFAVNHHPEIIDRSRQLLILQQMKERGEVTQSWYEERLDLLTGTYPDEDIERSLAVTSDYTIVGPLRYYIFRELRKRAEALGKSVPFHEDRMIDSYAVQ